MARLINKEASTLGLFDGFPFGIAGSFEWFESEGHSAAECLARIANVLPEFDAYQISIVGSTLSFLHWPIGRFPRLGLITAGTVVASKSKNGWIITYRFSTTLWLLIILLLVPVAYLAPSLESKSLQDPYQLLATLLFTGVLFTATYAFSFVRAEQVLSRSFPLRRRL